MSLAAPAQRLSQVLSQQNASCEQTHASHAPSEHPGKVLAVQQAPVPPPVVPPPVVPPPAQLQLKEQASVAMPAQMVSQLVSQQNESEAQTHAWHAPSEQPGVPLFSQQSAPPPVPPPVVPPPPQSAS